MGILQYQGTIQSDFLSIPLGIARFYSQGTGVYLASDIKNGAIKLTLNAGQIANIKNATHITADTDVITVPWGNGTKDFTLPDINAALSASNTSSITIYADGAATTTNRFEAVRFETDGQTYLALSGALGTGIATFSVSNTGVLTQHAWLDGTDGGYTDRPASLAVATFGNDQVLISVSSTDDSISSFKIMANGQIEHIKTIGVANFLPVGAPQDVATLSTAGRAYVVMASSDTSSLTVFHLTRDGNLTAVDQVVDDLSTRMQGANIIESFTIGDRAFILAAGQDSGISLFGVLPDGQLLHLETIADQTDTPIDNITDMYVAQVDGEYQLFTISGAETGIGQFKLNLDDLGLTATVDDDSIQGTSQNDLLILDNQDRSVDGGAGDDILKDGNGHNTLIGGEGSDLFILTSDGKMDTIVDFDPDLDQLDLSNWPFFRSVSQLDITSTELGAEIRFGNEILQVLSANGDALVASDFTDKNTINATHVDTSFVFDGINEKPITLADLKSSFHDVATQTGHLGNTENNVLVGDNLAQTLRGNGGHDVLRGGDSGDVLIGGEGIDIADYADANKGVVANLGNSSENTGFAAGDQFSGIEALTGSGFDDTLSGDTTDNALFGEHGDDVIHAQAGNDYLYGNQGHDWMDGGMGHDVLHGGDDNDALLGRIGNDILYGGAGDDNIASHTGNDDVYGGAGNDQMGGNDGDDRMFGGSGNDVIGSGSHEDFIDAGIGDDIASGGWGQDQVYGGTGNDTLAGSYGDDIVVGGDGNDDLGGGTGTDEIYAGNGNDAIGAGHDNDWVYAGNHNDFIGGGSGDDNLFGDNGNDTINAGSGNDNIFGGDGQDIYVFNSFYEGEIDTIQDWNATEDLIRMRSVKGRFDGLEISTITVDGTDYTEIAYDGHRIRLADTDSPSITADDFIFIG